MNIRKINFDSFENNTMNHSGINTYSAEDVYNVTVSVEEADQLIKDAGTITLNLSEESEN